MGGGGIVGAAAGGGGIAGAVVGGGGMVVAPPYPKAEGGIGATAVAGGGPAGARAHNRSELRQKHTRHAEHAGVRGARKWRYLEAARTPELLRARVRQDTWALLAATLGRQALAAAACQQEGPQTTALLARVALRAAEARTARTASSPQAALAVHRTPGWVAPWEAGASAGRSRAWQGLQAGSAPASEARRRAACCRTAGSSCLLSSL